MKEQVLEYIRQNPGCTSTGVNKAVREDQSWADWIYTRQDIDSLIKEGLVYSELDACGVPLFYANEKPA